MGLNNFEIDTPELAAAKDLIRELASALVGTGLEQLEVVNDACEFLDEHITDWNT